jgi:hypothetical protein
MAASSSTAARRKRACLAQGAAGRPPLLARAHSQLHAAGRRVGGLRAARGRRRRARLARWSPPPRRCPPPKRELRASGPAFAAGRALPTPRLHRSQRSAAPAQLPTPRLHRLGGRRGRGGRAGRPLVHAGIDLARARSARHRLGCAAADRQRSSLTRAASTPSELALRRGLSHGGIGLGTRVVLGGGGRLRDGARDQSSPTTPTPAACAASTTSASSRARSRCAQAAAAVARVRPRAGSRGRMLRLRLAAEDAARLRR